MKKTLSSLFLNASIDESIKNNDETKEVLLKIPPISRVIFSNEQQYAFVSVNNKIDTPEVSTALNKYYNLCQKILLFQKKLYN